MKKDEVLWHNGLRSYVLVVGPTDAGTVLVTDRNGTVVEATQDELEPLLWNPPFLACGDESAHDIHAWLENREDDSVMWRCLGLSDS